MDQAEGITRSRVKANNVTSSPPRVSTAEPSTQDDLSKLAVIHVDTTLHPNDGNAGQLVQPEKHPVYGGSSSSSSSSSGGSVLKYRRITGALVSLLFVVGMLLHASGGTTEVYQSYFPTPLTALQMSLFSEEHSTVSLSAQATQPVVERIVHIDMKGFASKPGYLVKLFPYLRDWGATGVLMEWEDALPYAGTPLSLLRGEVAYTPMDVERVVTAAVEHGLEIIPMLPSIDGLEFVLKHRQFSFMRGGNSDIGSICPSHASTQATLLTLLDQLLYYHPNTRRIHLGGAFGTHFETCPVCSQTRENAGGHDKDALETYSIFTRHMGGLIEYLAQQDVDSMLWDTPFTLLDNTDLLALYPKHIQIVVPNDLNDIGNNATAQMFSDTTAIRSPVLNEERWETYREAVGADNMFGAATFKSAELSSAVVDIDERTSNVVNWLRLSSLLDGKLRGVMLMGSSRSSHFGELTQSLPASLPSLCLALKILKHGYYDEAMRRDVMQTLGLLELDSVAASSSRSSVGEWPGKEVYEFSKRFADATEALDVAIASDPGGSSQQKLFSSVHDLQREADFVLAGTMYENSMQEMMSELTKKTQQLTASRTASTLTYNVVDASSATQTYTGISSVSVLVTSLLAAAWLAGTRS